MTISLDETWTFCIRMAKWIAKEMRRDDSQDIDDLKGAYLRQHHPDLQLTLNCFFCDYAAQCHNCPGVLIDPRFRCYNFAYHFRGRPTDFHKELVRLNKIRKANPKQKIKGQ